MSITTIPALLGIFALAFLLLLFAKVVKQAAEDKTAKQLLILLLVGLFSMAFCVFYINSRMSQYWPRLAYFEIGFVYWIGPSLYFYVRRLVGGPSPFANPLNLAHWLPAIVIELALLPFFLLPLPEKVAYLEHPSGIYRQMIWLTWAGFHFQLFVYILFCLPHLRVYRQRMADAYSDASVNNLRWLQLLCYGLIGVVVLAWALQLLRTSRGVSNIAGSRRTCSSSCWLIPVWDKAGCDSRMDGHRFQATASINARRCGTIPRNIICDKLNRLMATERYYLEGDLSLKSLADRVKLSPHHLSQILNEKLHKSFYEYINEQRVEHAKQALLQEPQKSITDIAFESGYNSRNSFYNSFKRRTGMMPSEYRRTHGLSAERSDTHETTVTGLNPSGFSSQRVPRP